MTTQQDVARLAGTSSAVVSYVLNSGPRPVSEQTRRRVLDAVVELNYRPNSAARSLRSGKSQVLGLVIPDSSHPFFADIAREMEKASYDRGYVIMTGNSMSDATREAEYFALFREHQVDGVLLTVNPAASLEGLLKASIPVVLLDQPSPELQISSMTVDYYAAAFDATRYLIESGHTHVAFVGGNKGLPSADARHAGWQAAMQEAGLPTRTSCRVPFSREGGYQAGLEVLSATERATAAFISSDQQAIGFLRGAAELDIRIPDDFWLVAFDDSDDCLYTNPTLSTVRQPMAEMIGRGLDLLLSPPAKPKHEIYAHELVLRRSTGTVWLRRTATPAQPVTEPILLRGAKPKPQKETTHS